MRKCLIASFVLFLMVPSVGATSLRIIGMGSLDLVVEDESNRINLFDYGQNVAGFYSDEMGSSIETYVIHGTVGNSDSSGTREPETNYWGINLPYLDLSAPVDIGIGSNTFSSLSGIPTGVQFNHRAENGFAFGAIGAYSSSSSKYESWNREDMVSMPLGNILFSKDFGVYSAGASGGFGKISYTNNQDSSVINASLKGAQIAGAMHLSPMLDIGVNGGIAFPDASLEASWYRQSFDGNAFSMGVQGISRIPGLMKFGVKFGATSSGLDGKTTFGNITIESGDMNSMDFLFDTKVLFSSILLPLKVGADIGYRKIHTTFNDTLLTISDNSLSVTDLGFGVSYALPFLTPGIQGNIRNQSSADNLGNAGVANSNQWSVRIGGEFGLNSLSIRAGYIIKKEDPDRDIESDEKSSRSITVGAGILLPFKIEIAYVNKETKPVDNPIERKKTDNTVYSALKVSF